MPSKISVWRHIKEYRKYINHERKCKINKFKKYIFVEKYISKVNVQIESDLCNAIL